MRYGTWGRGHGVMGLEVWEMWDTLTFKPIHTPINIIVSQDQRSMSVDSLIVGLGHLADEGAGVLQIELPQLCGIGRWGGDDRISTFIPTDEVTERERPCQQGLHRSMTVHTLDGRPLRCQESASCVVPRPLSGCVPVSCQYGPGSQTP